MKHTYKIVLSAVLILTLLTSTTAFATGDLIIGDELLPSTSLATIDINATKLFDGQDPGERKFTFKVWKLTAEQLLTVFPELLTEAETDIPVVTPPDVMVTDIVIGQRTETPAPITTSTPAPQTTPPGAVEIVFPVITPPQYPILYTVAREITIGGITYTGNPYHSFVSSLTPEKSATILPRVRKALEQYPYTTVRNDGKNISVYHETFNQNELPVPFNATYYTVIAEVEEKGNGICEDTAICICGWSVQKRRVQIGGWLPDQKEFEDAFEGGITTTIFDCGLLYFARLSAEDGFISLKTPFDAEGEIQPEDVMLFRNKTCPNADPGDLPATGDSTSMLLLTATALMALAAIIALRRRA
ncbi:MAG: LPXTG cell wall anchor domain-containing protein [Clostridia bacterium]|nr:LPXTG cell wall anchor domain-containing protein [Clostridia bacterium]